MTGAYAAVLDTAAAAARAAAAVHRAHLGLTTVEDWTVKGTADFVTHVDQEAEAAIVDRVLSRHRGHAIMAEEGELVGALDDEWLWIVDPLDGTTNFLHGYPMFGVSIAVLHRGELAAAFVLGTPTGEEWSAVRGEGTRLDGRPVRVSRIRELRQSLIGTGFPFRSLDTISAYQREFEAVVRLTSGLRRAGSAALDLCHVATGYFDGFWEHSLAPWDYAAGVLLVREAGGVVTRMDGTPIDPLVAGSVLAGNPEIHADLEQVLRAAQV